MPRRPSAPAPGDLIGAFLGHPTGSPWAMRLTSTFNGRSRLAINRGHRLRVGVRCDDDFLTFPLHPVNQLSQANVARADTSIGDMAAPSTWYLMGSRGFTLRL